MRFNPTPTNLCIELAAHLPPRETNATRDDNCIVVIVFVLSGSIEVVLIAAFEDFSNPSILGFAVHLLISLSEFA